MKKYQNLTDGFDVVDNFLSSSKGEVKRHRI